MLRKLGIGFTTLAALGPGIAAALGVGDYQLYSYLNQPLKMEVELRELGDLSADELKVRLASDADYARAGVERLHFHSDLKFEVETQADGNGSINIRSAQAVREPYLNFLVEIHWPTGRLLREYTVLLDPPSYAQAIAVERSVQSETIVTPVAPVPRAREQTPVSSASPESRPAVAQAAQQRSPRHQQYQVQPADTMWSIATRYRPDTSVSVQQMLVAIQDLNPDAFINGNVNLVREGVVLRIPVEEEMRRIQARDAISEVATQNQRWEDMLEARGIAVPRAPLDARAEKPEEAVSATDAPDATTGQVTLVSPETSGSGAAGSASGADEPADPVADARLRNQLVAQQENLEKLQRENRELSSRLSDLEQQVATGDQLLRLRNDQIARLQDELRKMRESAESSGVAVEAADPSLMEPVESPDSLTTAGEDVADTSESTPSDDADGGSAETSLADTDGMQSAEVAAETATPEDVEVAAPVTPDRPQVAEAPVSKEPTLVDLVVANMMFLLALVLVLLLAVVAVVLRRRKAASAESEEASSPSVAVIADDNEAASRDWEDDASDEASAGSETEDQDPLEQVEVYVAYGQFPQAIGYLRGEIANSPERSDLKVRLFELLAESGDKGGFDEAAEQYQGSDNNLDKRIEALRGGFAGGDQPSLDDLEMDLSSNLETDHQAAQQAPTGALEEDSDLLEDEFELSLDDEVVEESDADATVIGEAPVIEDDEQSLDDLGDFELDIDGDADGQQGSSEGEMEFELDLDAELEDVDLADTTSAEDESAPEVGELDLDLEDDDSELSEWQAETGEEEDQTMVSSPAIELDDAGDAFTADDTQAFEEVSLDDVSDEFAGTESSAVDEEDDLDLSLDELELDDQPTRRDAQALDVGEAEADITTEQAALDTLEEPVSEDDTVVDQPAIAAEAEETAVTTAIPEISDDDDFSFLGDADENATKLDLAKAYIDMGDKEGARDILTEVLNEGSPEQQAEAKSLIDQV